jgi:hypothetical protein
MLKMLKNSVSFDFMQQMEGTGQGPDPPDMGFFKRWGQGKALIPG